MKTKNYITVILCGLFIMIFSLWCFLIKTPEYSESERRMLAKFPEISWDAISTGKFSTEFEGYTTDRFPLRDTWRSIKAYARYFAFMQNENNGIYIKNGHLSKQEYPMNKEMMDYASELFKRINEKYLKDNNVYFAMIPDKNAFLSDLKFNYDAFESYMHQSLDFATPIKISNLLSSDDYYYTDTHWRQNKIIDVAKKLAEGLGVTLKDEYTENILETPFYGVYAGQSALKVQPDTITYLTNNTIDNLIVTGANDVYDLAKATGKDPYEFFLSGNQPVITIDNPLNTTGKRLIIFRDSFGSSITPLLLEGYSQVVLADLRYINSQLLDKFIDFKNADVLFLYSTMLLNNSLAMK